ncbi:MAG TPA: serine hydroxymethyltransferase [Candidatus Fraserbacteria bacterium]|nr:serine hydroxymethyltransferase [Candidatus Fraserbacteria bacterium]
MPQTDPELYQALQGELERQRRTIELIASENFTSPEVLAVAGSVLTNKYAEGYPGRRYYGGCHFVDQAEELARRRLLKLFGGEHANVQPHSGSQANMAAYLALMRPGDTLMGLALDQGGHLTHGHPVSFSGQLFQVVHYGLDRQSEEIDYDRMLELAREHRPQVIVCGASAYPREINFARIRQICDAVGAYMVADIAHIAGLVATGLHPSPLPYADVVTTTTHKTLRGPRGGAIICKAEQAKAIDKAVFPGLQGGPLMHIIAAKAAAFGQALSPEFKAYQRQILANAAALARALSERGFRLVSGGTDTHLMLVDLRPKGVSGVQAERLLEQVGITANKNAIPFDPEKPTVTSGLRLGTPTVTTRGMGPAEMEQIAELIDRAVAAIGSEAEEQVKGELRERVRALCERFPLYADL